MGTHYCYLALILILEKRRIMCFHMAPERGIEPTTKRVKVSCATTTPFGNIWYANF